MWRENRSKGAWMFVTSARLARSRSSLPLRGYHVQTPHLSFVNLGAVAML